MIDQEIPALPEGLKWYYFPKEHGHEAPCCGGTFPVVVAPEPNHVPSPFHDHLILLVAMGPREALEEHGREFTGIIPVGQGLAQSFYLYYGHHAEEVRRFTAARLQAAADSLKSEEPLAAEPDA